VVAVVAFFLRRPLIGLFLDTGVSEGAEALAVGVRYLTVLTLLLFILYLLHIFRSALLSLGKSFYSMISGIAELAARALMAKAAVRVLGQDALFLAEPIAWAVALAVVMIPYFVYRRTRLREE
jgi:Na+-driven multidrug efflux pump